MARNETGNKNLYMNKKDEIEANKRAKKAIAKIEMMKLKRQKKAYAQTESSSMGMGPKIMFISVVVLGVVAYMKQNTPEQSKFSFVEAQAHCEEQGKLLPLTLDDDPQHLLNIQTIEAGRAYWSAKGKLLYNMDLGHQNHLPDAKHYVVCVDENGKTGAMPIGSTPVER